MSATSDFLEGKGLDLRDALRPLVPMMATKEEMAAMAEKRKKEQARYGKNGSLQYFRDKYMVEDPEAEQMKFINTAIYEGSFPFFHGDGPSGRSHAANMKNRFESRMRELYKAEYDRLKNHDPKDPEVAKLLLDDALRTGKKAELPDVLQEQFTASRFGKRKKG